MRSTGFPIETAGTRFGTRFGTRAGSCDARLGALAPELLWGRQQPDLGESCSGNWVLQGITHHPHFTVGGGVLENAGVDDGAVIRGGGDGGHVLDLRVLRFFGIDLDGEADVAEYCVCLVCGQDELCTRRRIDCASADTTVEQVMEKTEDIGMTAGGAP